MFKIEIIVVFQKVNKESMHMRDATKLVVLRQEHNSQVSTKARSRLLGNFRQQGEEHRQELERLERKLLTISMRCDILKRKKWKITEI